jgi:hypothetical protein
LIAFQDFEENGPIVVGWGGLGRMGGSKPVRKFVPIIQNERQVFHVVISKSYPPGQSHGLGHVVVSRMH